MTVTKTKLSDMVNPQVMGDMISAELPNKIKFYPLATVDTRLQGRPGSTLRVPKFAYIGAAADVAEGDDMNVEKLESSYADFAIKKAGKGVEITDEAVLSGLGDPLGEAKNQLTMAIADKIDGDLVTALEGATLKHEKAGTFDLNVVSDGLDKFTDEDDEAKVMVMHPLDASVLRKAATDSWQRASDLTDRIITNGTYGSILDCQVVRSRRVKRGLAHVVKPGALAIFMKRNVEVEDDRDIVAKSTVITADEHYGTYLYDESKAVNIDVRTTVTITAKITDAATAGASVTFNGETKLTDSDGKAVFKAVAGKYSATATKTTTTLTKDITVVDGTPKAEDMVMV